MQDPTKPVLIYMVIVPGAVSNEDELFALGMDNGISELVLGPDRRLDCTVSLRFQGGSGRHEIGITFDADYRHQAAKTVQFDGRGYRHFCQFSTQEVTDIRPGEYRDYPFVYWLDGEQVGEQWLRLYLP